MKFTIYNWEFTIRRPHLCNEPLCPMRLHPQT